MTRHRIDVIGLQETHCPNDSAEYLWNQDFPSMNVFWSHGTSHSCGVAICIARRLNPSNILLRRDDSGRFLSISFHVESTHHTFTCMYAPTNTPDRMTFFRKHLSPVASTNNHVIVGDFNTALTTLDRLHPTARPDPSAAYLTSLLRRNNLTDLFRTRHPQTPGYTWKRPDGTQMTRLDFILGTEDVTPKVTSVTIWPIAWSDHSLVIAQTTDGPQRGHGYWKLNVSLLKDEEYCKRVTHFWESWQCQKFRFPSIIDWWDVAKAHIRDISREYGAKLANEKNQRRRELERAIEKCQRLVASNQSQFNSLLRQHEKSIRDMDNEIRIGAKIRSRVQWAEEGEKSTRFFFGLEKHKGQTSTISELLDNQGQVKHTTRDMLETTAKFYEDLFTPNSLDQTATNQLLRSLDKRLSAEERTMLDSKLNSDECLQAAKSLSTNKAPGIDGLPIEFYRRFWPMLETDLLQVYQDVLATSKLSYTQRSGVVRLIYKKGERRNLKNWRPITLLTSDYKILTKTLANRMKSVLHSVVSIDQTCCVPGRSIFDNCRLLQDVVDYCNLTGQAAALVSIDQEKAFDRVNWKYLDQVLETINVGPVFRQWTQLLYTDITSQIIVNGWLTRPIPIKRGVRQGCPLSAILYVLASEALGSSVRKSTLSGLVLPDSEPITISQYADDTTIIVTKNYEFDTVNQLVNTYETGSGAKLNRSKSRGLWLGKWRHRIDQPMSFTWTNDRLKALGIILGSGNDVIKENWTIARDKFEAILQRWKNRDLSFFGRALVAKSLATAKIWYVAKVSPPPADILKSINQSLWQFIWRNKTALVNRKTCIQPQRCGGLGAISIQEKVDSFLLQWISRLLDDKPRPWKPFSLFWLDKIGQPFTDHKGVLCGTKTPIPTCIPPFYRNLVYIFRNHDGGNPGKPTCEEQVNRQPLFGNHQIRDDKGRCMFSLTMANVGIRTIGDLRTTQVRGRCLTRLLEKLHRAIPAEWLLLPPSGEPQTTAPPHLYHSTHNSITLSLAPRKSLYQRMIDRSSPPPTALQAWQATQTDTLLLWPNAWKALEAAKLPSPYSRDIGFKFLHRVLPTRQRLHRWGLTTDPRCQLCNYNEETLQHVFRDCPRAILMKRTLHSFLSAVVSENLDPNLDLLSAPFRVHTPETAFIVWTIVTHFWKHRSNLSHSEVVRLVERQIRRKKTDERRQAYFDTTIRRQQTE